MILDSLRLRGFRSFKHEQRLSLDIPPGLYLVTGFNEVEPELGANGVGKSTLFEAVNWALKGVTSRKLKAGAIENWAGGEKCGVVLNFKEGQIARTQNPNALLLDEEPVDQDTLDAALGFSADVFQNMVYFPQGMRFFVNLLPTARMDLYSEVLDLDSWEHKSTQAKLYAEEAQTEVQRLEVELARLEERGSVLAGLRYTKEMAEFEAARKAKDAALGEKRVLLGEQFNTANRERNELTQALIEADTDAKKEAAGWEKMKLRARLARSEFAQCEGAAQNLTEQVDRADYALDHAPSEGTCQRCGQKVTKQHAAQHRSEMLAARQALHTRLLACLDKGVELEEIAVHAEAELDEFKSEAAEGVRELEHMRNSIDEHIHVLEQRSRDINAQRDAIAAEVNPFKAQAEKTKREQVAVTKLVDALQTELAEAREAVAHFSFWIKGFKDIRFQIIQESLAQLNTEANECLHQLGLSGWALEFSVERETKSGTIKRGFLVDVHNPHTNERAPWEAYSWGEGARLALAAQLGVSNMLASRGGHSFNFEMWDEPTNWLTQGGIMELLSVLQDRAQRYSRVILLADHRALDFPFDGRIDIIKKETGSEIHTSW